METYEVQVGMRVVYTGTLLRGGLRNDTVYVIRGLEGDLVRVAEANGPEYRTSASHLASAQGGVLGGLKGMG